VNKRRNIFVYLIPAGSDIYRKKRFKKNDDPRGGGYSMLIGGNTFDPSGVVVVHGSIFSIDI
jgi:hypothetical protein